LKVRWLPVLLVVSLLANVGAVFLTIVAAVDSGHYQADQASSWRSMTTERAELRAMRAHFCPSNAAPERTAVLAWEESVRSAPRYGEPFEKDGLLWLSVVGVKFDSENRLTGVCLSQTWALLDDAPLSDQDRAGELCPLEPLC
jgi:hypothetical protein